MQLGSRDTFLGRMHRSTIYVDVTDRVAWSVGPTITLVSPAKTAAQIELPFGLRTGPKEPRIRWVSRSLMGEAILRGERASHCKV